jgi:predicted nuclease with TOPRIM domain
MKVGSNMGECSNELVIEHTKELTKLRSEVDELQCKVGDMSQIKEAIIKLTILQEEQNRFSGEVSETLKEMNSEIKETKEEVRNTNDKVNGLETKFEEKIIEIDNKSKIDILMMVKDWIPKLILGGIAYYILQVVGVIKF